MGGKILIEGVLHRRSHSIPLSPGLRIRTNEIAPAHGKVNFSIYYFLVKVLSYDFWWVHLSPSVSQEIIVDIILAHLSREGDSADSEM